MRLLFFSCLFFAVIFIFSSCSYKQDQVLFERKSPLQDTGVIKKAIATASSYRIKPQDVLQIRNLQNSKTVVDMNPAINSNLLGSTVTQPETYLVEDDGTVSLTGLGPVQVTGLTRIQAQKLIEGLYSKDLKRPIIELKIINLKVTLLGEIKNQGNFPLVKDKTTLVELIGEAGGLTESADEKNIQIIRSAQISPVVITADLSNINTLTDSDTILQSGDIIYIVQNKRAIRAAKNKNFANILQPGLLILSSALLLFSIMRR